MELEFDRNTMIYYETVANMTVCQEETLESIVPDACPDILRIVDVCGQAILTSKQAKERTAVVSGMVRAYILYQPENSSGLRRMEVGIPFTCQVDAPNLTEQGTVLARPRLRRAEARALNPRKVLLRVDLAVDITACQPMQRSVCCGVLNEETNAICQRQFNGETYQLFSVQEKPFTFSEQVKLLAGQGEPPQVLAIRAEPLCTEHKLIGSKLIFKGTVDLHLLLQESSGSLSSSHESLPFSQIMEVPGAEEGGDGQVFVELTDLQYDPDSTDSRSMEVSMEFLAQVQVRSRRSVTLLQDLYSTAWQTEVDAEVQTLCRFGEQSVRPQAVRELLETGEMVRSVIDSRIALGQMSQNRDGEQMDLSVECWLTVLYLDENELVQCVRRTVQVSTQIDCPAGYQCNCVSLCPDDIFASPAAGGVEVRFTVEFQYLTICPYSVASVKGGRLGEVRASEDGPRPSIVLRLAAPGEGIWEIAKAYGTTKEQILQANELEQEELPEEKMLLIPRIR
ncbi:MAG: SPOCS domain-containing protein [Lawsonibacter sp.]